IFFSSGRLGKHIPGQLPLNTFHSVCVVPCSLLFPSKMQKKYIEFINMMMLRGPNIWAYRPVIEAWVDIGELEDYPSNVIPGFYERLVAWLPSLIEHRC